MAIFIRTDVPPAAPGTASRLVVLATTTTTTTASVSLYRVTLNLAPAGYSGDYYDLASASLSLTGRTMVIAVGVLLHAYADADAVVGLSIAISGIGEPVGKPISSTPTTSPYVVYYNIVLQPGSYTITLRLRNSDSTINHYVYVYGAEDTDGFRVLGYLIVYAVPLE